MQNIYYYKINNITEIHIRKQSVETAYKYKEVYTEKSWWLGKTKFYFNTFVEFCDYNNYVVSREDILSSKNREGENRYIIVGDVVFNRVSVAIGFSHHKASNFYKLFDSFVEAEKWVDDLLEENGLNKEIVALN